MTPHLNAPSVTETTTPAKRQWLYPRVVKGRFYRWRTAVAWVFLAALFSGPFLSYNGQPLFLFNVLERKFNIFGVTFWPQDFYLVAIGLLAFIVFIALFTVVYGRVFCGWACPQTVFLEMVFRKIEIWIEGDSNARRRLDAAPWTTDKILKKSAKYSIFFLISFAISNTFLAYIIGKDALLTIITDNPANHVGGLSIILLFTGVFYTVFAYVREYVCTTICPYGRLQSVLLDKQSVMVAYDDVRGEPRGKLVKNEELRMKNMVETDYSSFLTLHSSLNKKGDCIDCKLCVQVCPTGIDIRKGTQMECVNCTLCIDACDDIMDKIDRPRGLIRYDSLEGIQTRQPWRMTRRMMGYSVVLVLLMSVWGFLLWTRSDLDTTLLRAPGQLYQREAERGPGGGLISNLYLIELVNKTHKEKPVSFRVDYPGATLRMVQPLTKAPADELTKGMFFILLPEKNIHEVSTKLTVEVVSDGVVVDRVKTTFLGPVN
ncbi:cytochrome c oxidase accessory protein CcoG [Spirosoma sp. KCTC 42546]|uniref:cytochrome c oxidase accessory protein CcoG n=1 Tax=Spirosoma sp. KCTC 42546 TaxID=2520506 RepID=UPI00115A2629|nr:cytochrome c oxidase accessory protein CcoG [Spirosoma sp. KCTC 42546]QDK82173.1 cytochrome c oxidase accessory protein CcoG [Spirosoma sp. KCTC 42546]